MQFCDLNCLYANWPKDEGTDGSGSCRTFQAIFCEKKDRLVHKNAPCQDKEISHHRATEDTESV